MMKNIKYTLGILTSTLLLISCGNDKKQTTPTENTVPTEQVPADTNSIHLTLQSNDQMQYDQKEIKVPVNKTIILTLKHTGKMDKAVMGHNFVLLKKGTDFDAFSKIASSAPTDDYLPASEKNNTIAHTRVLGGGESDTIEFMLTETGTYDFLCTFPAHAALMRGVIIAE